WEVRVADRVARRAGRGLAARVVDHILGLLRVLARVRANRLGGAVRVVGRKGADLARRVVDDGTSLVNLLVDEFLVGDVNERPEEGSAGGQEREAPQRQPLDEPV